MFVLSSGDDAAMTMMNDSFLCYVLAFSLLLSDRLLVTMTSHNSELRSVAQDVLPNSAHGVN